MIKEMGHPANEHRGQLEVTTICGQIQGAGEWIQKFARGGDPTLARQVKPVVRGVHMKEGRFSFQTVQQRLVNLLLGCDEQVRSLIFQRLHSGQELPQYLVRRCLQDSLLGSDVMCRCISLNNTALLSQLCRAGVSGNQVSTHGSSPIIPAANCRNASAISELVSFGTKVDTVPRVGVPRAIFYAMGSEMDAFESGDLILGSGELCSKMLLRLGAAPIALGNEVESPIEYAKRLGHPVYVDPN